MRTAVALVPYLFVWKLVSVDIHLARNDVCRRRNTAVIGIALPLRGLQGTMHMHTHTHTRARARFSSKAVNKHTYSRLRTA